MAPLLKHTEVDVNAAYDPERVELVDNNRIIGRLTPQCLQRAAALYRILVEDELSVGNTRTSKMCELAENSYRDVNIALANDYRGPARCASAVGAAMARQGSSQTVIDALGLLAYQRNKK